MAGDEDAARTVAEVVDRLGFDAIYSGGLATGAAFQPGTEIFVGAFTHDELRERLAEAATLSASAA